MRTHKIKPAFKADPSKVRLSSAEQSALLDLFALIDRIARMLEKGALHKRLSGIPRSEAKLKTCLTYARQVSQAVLESAPSEQIWHLKNNLKHLHIWIYVGGASVRKDSDDGRWLSINELNAVASAIRETCLTCTKDTQEQRSCQYAKLLDVLPCDRVETDGCGWFETLGSI